RVVVQSLVDTAVMAQIGLLVALQTGRRQAHRTARRGLEDARRLAIGKHQAHAPDEDLIHRAFEPVFHSALASAPLRRSRTRRGGPLTKKRPHPRGTTSSTTHQPAITGFPSAASLPCPAPPAAPRSGRSQRWPCARPSGGSAG